MEKPVLKLVHPGRHVEIHKSPRTAAEIMRKNPRHCIAWPDVFEFPWIVVRPESVLVPGRVFYVVPNRAIYHLLKARGLCNQSSRQKQSPKNYGHHCIPKAMDKRQHPHQLCLQKLYQITPQASSQQADFESYMESQFEPTIRNINTCQEFDHESKVNSSVDVRPLYTKEYLFHGSNFSSSLPKIKLVDLQYRSCEQINLKSCLRKQDSVHKSLNLRVTFASPITIASSGREYQYCNTMGELTSLLTQ